MPAWVFFDVDQTLCDFDASMRRALTSTLTEIRRRYPSDQAEALTEADLVSARNAVAATASPTTSMEDIRRRSFADVLTTIAPTAPTADVDTITAFYLDARFDQPSVYPDTVSTLDELGRHYRLGVISNGNSYPRHLGLHEHFAEVVLASQVGVFKPDRAIYDLAAVRTGHPPEDLVMVGDSQAHDVDAALAAGWQAVWLDRDRTGASANAPTITSLSELLGPTSPLTTHRED